MRAGLFATFTLAAGPACAQSPSIYRAPSPEAFIPAGYAVLHRAGADFNGDGLRDVLLVLANQADPDAGRPLLILFRDPAGGYTLSIRTDQAVPEAATGGAAANDGFDGIRLRGNTFIISRYGGSSVRHADAWQFRYQQGVWVLIGEMLAASGPGGRCRRAGRCALPSSCRSLAAQVNRRGARRHRCGLETDLVDSGQRGLRAHPRRIPEMPSRVLLVVGER